MSTTQELLPPPAEKAEKNSADSSPRKPSGRTSRRRRKHRPERRSCDHIPIIIFLLVIFSFSLLCIGIGLTRYLEPERAGIPACGLTPCSSFNAPTVAQKGGGE